MESIYGRLKQVGIIPVIKIDTPEHAVPLAKALCAGGLPAAEITFRSEAAKEAIARIVKAVPEMLVIAGTVLTPETAEEAVIAGASGIVSPGFNPETTDWCITHNIPIIPGTATPSEIEACMRKGLSVVKLFPAEVLGGVNYLKALAGPYSSMRFMPTGGIKPSNAKEYLSQKNVLCCGGTWMVPAEHLISENFDEIEQLATEASSLIQRK